MTPREFFNAWQGHSKQESDRMEAQIKAMRNITFSAARFNAASTAMSKEASRSISRYKFPWEKPQSDPNSVRNFIKSQKRMIERTKNGR